MVRHLRDKALPFLAVLLAIGASGCQPEATEPPPPRTARVMDADPKEMPIIVDGSGTIAARNTSSVGFLVGGRLLSRDVDVGTVVKTGDIIAKLDPTDMKNQLDSANAQVKAAEAAVAQATPQEAAKRKLLKDGFTTQADYDQALKALQSAEADLSNAQAQQRLATDQLNYTTLNAPVGGSVIQTGADAGQVVSAGQMIVQIAQNDGIDAVFSVAARVAAGAKIGTEVTVSLQDDPNIKVVGTVREIAPSPDPVTGTYTVKIALPDPPPQMRLGNLVNGHVEVPGPVLISLPTTALLQTGDTAAVWVVAADGTVSKKPVKVDRYDSNAVLIAEGLNKGDVVVIAGVNSLAEGQKVTPEKVAAP